jgi:hypothetical protein
MLTQEINNEMDSAKSTHSPGRPRNLGAYENIAFLFVRVCYSSYCSVLDKKAASGTEHEENFSSDYADGRFVYIYVLLSVQR